MDTADLVAAIISFVCMALCACISARQFVEKGFLFNNAYLWASKEERASMDKKPHYRQSAIVFCLLSAVFLVSGLSVMFQIRKWMLLEIPLIIGAVVYAIISSIRIEKRTKR